MKHGGSGRITDQINTGLVSGDIGNNSFWFTGVKVAMRTNSIFQFYIGIFFIPGFQRKPWDKPDGVFLFTHGMP
jgi:hypothetical protein